MTEESQIDLVALQQEVESTDIEPRAVLKFTDFDKQGNKTTKLLPDSGDQEPLDSKNRWFEFSLKKPAFVFVLRATVQGFEDYNRFEVEWLDTQKRRHFGIVKPSGGFLDIFVNAYVTQVRFRPPSSFFAKRKILQVELWGAKPEGLSGLLKTLYSIESHKNAALSLLNKTKETRDALAGEISAKSSLIEDLGPVDKLDSQARRDVIQDSFCGGYLGAVADGGCRVGVL